MQSLELEIHHIGYAVQSISEYLKRSISPLFDPAVSPIVEDPIQRVRIAFVKLPGGTLELIEPAAADSPVQQILSRKRGGLYHVGYATPHFEAAIACASRSGYRAISKPAPAAAFDLRRVVFFMSPDFELIEFIEMPKATGR